MKYRSFRESAPQNQKHSDPQATGIARSCRRGSVRRRAAGALAHRRAGLRVLPSELRVLAELLLVELPDVRVREVCVREVRVLEGGAGEHRVVEDGAAEGRAFPEPAVQNAVTEVRPVELRARRVDLGELRLLEVRL